MAADLRPDQIPAADWQLRVGELGEVVTGLADVDQCVRVILGTPKGSVPHRPDFGTEIWRYVDWPVDQARPHIVREVLDAVGTWEPRVLIAAVVVDVDAVRPGRLAVTVSRKLRGDAGGDAAPLTVAL